MQLEPRIRKAIPWDAVIARNAKKAAIVGDRAVASEKLQKRASVYR